ncbi:DUF58 domain-containing protein [Brachybacterium endophyticum]|uniref:DUF58 domain-containing protein n=1 Tax=Brachybacterium endophyticum TaxID=2182385 RepID=A0A2U2RKL1_9MICO|nr:DUF58 domain-containing protein [Brachybacterium endophyticum]PWH06324.1 DUF58 domain-containing protein [Brachybacterium endophyticum]
MAAAAEAVSAAASHVRIRPTARGAALVLIASLLWAGGEITGLMAGRLIGIALLLAMVLSVIAVLLLRRGLGLSRRVLDEAVTAGADARVDLRLLPTAMAARIPLGHGAVALDLPAALGGRGSLDLAARMPHHVSVTGRGIHELGDCTIRLRDPFGLMLLRARVEVPGRVIGLPRIENLEETGARRLGIGASEHESAYVGAGSGELGVIPRPYTAGDDIRRIHWRASARAGQLMTREEEPTRSEGAVIVLDTRGSQGDHGGTAPAGDRAAVEDRLLDHAASLLVSLAAHGWETRVLDAQGDEITRMLGRGGSGASPLGAEAGAISVRSALIDLVGVEFRPHCSPAATDHAAGHVDLAIALGPDHGEPFADLELDRFAGRASRRTAIALFPAPPEGADRGAVRAVHDGAWLRLSAPADLSLRDVLDASAGTEGAMRR